MHDPGYRALVCAVCWKRIEPGDVVVEAVERIPLTTESGIVEWVDGMSSPFHFDCYPAGSGHWRLLEVGEPRSG